MTSRVIFDNKCWAWTWIILMVKEIARIKQIHELNIGHSIIAESIFLGLSDAIKKMKNLIESTK